MLTKKKETYLGDGLYASDDGMHVWLRAPREDGDHEVALDGPTLSALLEFLERTRGVKIKVERLQ